MLLTELVKKIENVQFTTTEKKMEKEKSHTIKIVEVSPSDCVEGGWDVWVEVDGVEGNVSLLPLSNGVYDPDGVPSSWGSLDMWLSESLVDYAAAGDSRELLNEIEGEASEAIRRT